MVDISGHTTAESGIHDPLVVQSEHVDPMVGLLVQNGLLKKKANGQYTAVQSLEE